MSITNCNHNYRNKHNPNKKAISVKLITLSYRYCYHRTSIVQSPSFLFFALLLLFLSLLSSSTIITPAESFSPKHQNRNINNSSNNNNNNNNIYKKIQQLNKFIMTRKDQSLFYKELEWNEAPLYAPAPDTNTAPNQEECALKKQPPTLSTSLTSTSTSTSPTTILDDNTVNSSPAPLPLKAESTALLIVDVQPEYWSHCPSVRQDFPNFETNLKRTIDICRKQQAKIIWVRADYRYYHSPWLAQFERLNGGNRPDTKAEIPCDPSSQDFAWEEFATPIGNEVVIAKRSWNSATNTALLDYLKVNSIENVLVCGLITSVCVQHSAFSVFEAGYRTLLVEDSCGDRGMARHRAAIALYGNYMYEIITSEGLEDEERGLLPAKPKWMNWLTKDATTTTTKTEMMESYTGSSSVTSDISVVDDSTTCATSALKRNANDVIIINNNHENGDLSPKRTKLVHESKFDSSPDLISTDNNNHIAQQVPKFESE